MQSLGFKTLKYVVFVWEPG